MTDLTAVSLFAGVGGFDLALHRAGVRVVAAVEIDPSARGVLAHQFPDSVLFDDVRTVTGDQLRDAGFVPERGIICGGFPCQDLSVAGRGAGMDRDSGTRSALFWHIDRLLGELAPRWVLLENVPGLLSHGHGRTMGAVLGALGERGSGFAYRVLDAQHFGVPQRRRRVFIVGCLGDDRRPVEVLLEPESSGGDLASGIEAGPGVAGGSVAGALRTRVGQLDDADSVNLVVSALTANGVGTCGADDNQAQAGHLVPFVKSARSGAPGADGSLPPETWKRGGVSPTLNAFDNGHESRATVLAVLGEVTHALTSEGADASEDGTGRGTPIIAFSHTAGIDVQASDAVFPTVMAGHDRMPSVFAGGVRRLTARETERLQGFPPVIEWSDDMTRDEFTAALLASGVVTVDPAAGVVYRHRGPGGRPVPPREVPGSDCNGYRVATFHLAGMRRQVRLHRAVWIAAHGIPPEGMAVCHANNDKTDNRCENLYLATPAVNSTHAHRDGLVPPKEKVTVEQRRQIAADFREGKSARKLMEQYGLSKSRVYQIISEDDWTAQRLDEKSGRVVAQADSARYRQMGNAVAVPVVEWIIGRIVTTDGPR